MMAVMTDAMMGVMRDAMTAVMTDDSSKVIGHRTVEHDWHLPRDFHLLGLRRHRDLRLRRRDRGYRSHRTSIIQLRLRKEYKS